MFVSKKRYNTALARCKEQAKEIEQLNVYVAGYVKQLDLQHKVADEKVFAVEDAIAAKQAVENKLKQLELVADIQRQKELFTEVQEKAAAQVEEANVRMVQAMEAAKKLVKEAEEREGIWRSLVKSFFEDMLTRAYRIAWSSYRGGVSDEFLLVINRWKKVAETNKDVAGLLEAATKKAQAGRMR